jgi:hypothetical protein
MEHSFLKLSFTVAAGTNITYGEVVYEPLTEETVLDGPVQCLCCNQ